MSRFLLETIKCLDGKLINLAYHQHRFDLARKTSFLSPENVELSSAIQVPVHAQNGLFRCRVIYSQKIEKIEFLPHKYRTVKSLKLLEDNEIDYHLKYVDRERLKSLFDKRGDCDDILIVKNGCLTDSYNANTIFYDGTNWWTPDTPLLPGTQRARLIEEGQLKVCRITVDDLYKYSQAGLINAMQDLENMLVVKLDKIIHS